VDTVETAEQSNPYGGGAACLDMKVVLAYKKLKGALQFLTANPDDPWHDGSFPACEGRKIIPITDEDAGKNFLLEKAYDASNGEDPCDRRRQGSVRTFG
jgi:hypothetical protein